MTMISWVFFFCVSATLWVKTAKQRGLASQAINAAGSLGEKKRGERDISIIEGGGTGLRKEGTQCRDTRRDVYTMLKRHVSRGGAKRLDGSFCELADVLDDLRRCWTTRTFDTEDAEVLARSFRDRKSGHRKAYGRFASCERLQCCRSWLFDALCR